MFNVFFEVYIFAVATVEARAIEVATYYNAFFFEAAKFALACKI